MAPKNLLWDTVILQVGPDLRIEREVKTIEAIHAPIHHLIKNKDLRKAVKPLSP